LGQAKLQNRVAETNQAKLSKEVELLRLELDNGQHENSRLCKQVLDTETQLRNMQSTISAAMQESDGEKTRQRQEYISAIEK